MWQPTPPWSKLSDMPRLHLFEFHDLPACPPLLRQTLTELLEKAVRWTRIYDVTAPLLERLLTSSGGHQVVDLCSGGGGPWRDLVLRLRRDGRPVQVTLTDLYPDHERLGRHAAESAGAIRVASGPVDATRDAGTDLQGIRCNARKDGNHYVVNGAKTWITNSLEGDVIGLLVKTDPDASPPRKGMSMFIAEKGPGFNVTRKLKKLGYKGIDTAEISFEDYRVHKDCLIGGVEGRGFYNAVGGLELGRINVAARGVGVATAALKQATAYSQQRKTFGKPICEHQAIQLKLGEMATRAEAARLLVEQAAQAFDRGERCDMEAGMAKYFATEAAAKNADENMRIHGAYGYSCEFDVERLYRDAPLMIIGEGTNEMQRIIIARQLIERNPI